MSAITYQYGIDDLRASQLEGGFFEGWPSAPSAATHLAILSGSAHVIIARDGDEVVGFINALSDGALMAFVPLLEVLPAWRGQGVGRELVRRMLEVLREHYAIDLVCDEHLVAFYEAMGMRSVRAMALRHYANQAGRVNKEQA